MATAAGEGDHRRGHEVERCQGGLSALFPGVLEGGLRTHDGADGFRYRRHLVAARVDSRGPW